MEEEGNNSVEKIVRVPQPEVIYLQNQPSEIKIEVPVPEIQAQVEPPKAAEEKPIEIPDKEDQIGVPSNKSIERIIQEEIKVVQQEQSLLKISEQCFIHEGISCIKCGSRPIKGTRYKCFVC